MGKRLLAAAVVTALGAGAFALRPVEVEAAPPVLREPDPGAVPVVVELFTSEGCSSCPPADEVLARLERTQPVPGARIIPLALHVDYWDRLGWSDPFASSAWSARQRAYAPLGGGTYTPEALVDGKTQLVGSRGPALERAIEEAARAAHAKVDVEITDRVVVTVGALPPGAAPDAEAIVVVTQASAKVAVPKGENAGKSLEHTAIARELRVLGNVPASGASLEATLKLTKGLRVVAFVQERGSRRILGSATRAAR